MIEELREMIIDLCPDDIWKKHIESVIKYSLLLAEKLGADKEVCEISAILHDITKIRGQPKNHNITGAKEAGDILEGYGYNKIEEVKQCIISHSSNPDYVPVSLEAKIIASADAIAVIKEWETIISHDFKKGKSKKEIEEKFIKHYGKIMTEAKYLVKKDYEEIMKSLK